MASTFSRTESILILKLIRHQLEQVGRVESGGREGYPARLDGQGHTVAPLVDDIVGTAVEHHGVQEAAQGPDVRPLVYLTAGADLEEFRRAVAHRTSLSSRVLEVLR